MRHVESQRLLEEPRSRWPALLLRGFAQRRRSHKDRFGQELHAGRRRKNFPITPTPAICSPYGPQALRPPRSARDRRPPSPPARVIAQTLTDRTAAHARHRPTTTLTHASLHSQETDRIERRRRGPDHDEWSMRAPRAAIQACKVKSKIDF